MSLSIWAHAHQVSVTQRSAARRAAAAARIVLALSLGCRGHGAHRWVSSGSAERCDGDYHWCSYRLSDMKLLPSGI